MSVLGVWMSAWLEDDFKHYVVQMVYSLKSMTIELRTHEKLKLVKCHIAAAVNWVAFEPCDAVSMSLVMLWAAQPWDRGAGEVGMRGGGFPGPSSPVSVSLWKQNQRWRLMVRVVIVT